MFKIYNEDCLVQLEELEESSIDSIVTDPPYELNFMSKGWDNAGISFNKEIWQKCLRVLKPGGYLLAFGGSRTYHRIAVAIEDAGFEIRDTIMWLYGSGFPKSMNIGLAIDKKKGLQGQRGVGGFNVGGLEEQKNRKAKLYIGSTTDGSKQKGYTDYKSDLAKQWQGWGTCLKPSFEPIIIARKPFKGSLVDNVIEYGVGGINIDECRVSTNEIIEKGRNGRLNKSTFQASQTNDNQREFQNNGRFPANTILTYDETDFEEVCSGFPNTKGNNPKQLGEKGFWFEEKRDTKQMSKGYDDSGSASRYFYCAKASKKDRDEGLEEFEEKIECDGNEECYSADVPFNRSALPKKNIHPTVKPTELMQYLIRLVTPNGGTVLDPFMGSGSTGKACMYENKERNKNYNFIGIEKDKEYCEIARARISYAEKQITKEQEEKDNIDQISLF